jgi:hypothetical protein
MSPRIQSVAPWSLAVAFSGAVLSLGAAPQEVPDVAQAHLPPRLEVPPPPARLPDGVRVVSAFGGEESDFLGTSLCALGDISADGVPDFALGAGRVYGEGYVLAISGKDGCVLARWEGTRGAPEDGYGATICAIGDTDGDGVGDLAVGAPAWTEYRGYAAVYSGSSRELLYSLAGEAELDELPRVRMGELPPHNDEPFDDDAIFAGACIGSVLAPAVDVDGDGCSDFLLNDWLISGKNGHAIVRSRALALTGDLDGDGNRDCLFQRPREGEDEFELSFRPPVEDDALEFRTTLSLESLGRLELGNWGNVLVSEDVNGDGFLEVFVMSGDASPPDAQGGHPEFVRCHLIDGRHGRALLEWTQRGSSDGAELLCKPIGDVDGDRVVDFLTRTGPERAPCASWIVIRSGVDGRELYTMGSSDPDFGAQAVGIGDLDGDGRAELLISDSSACIEGVRGCGVAYVLSFAND